MHTSGADLDEEQDMQSAEGGGVDTGEVGRDDSFRLGANELRPGGSGPFGGRVDSRGPQDRPHRRRGDRIADTAQFALYAPIPSLWVLDGGTDRVATRFIVGSTDGSGSSKLNEHGGDGFRYPHSQVMILCAS